MQGYRLFVKAASWFNQPMRILARPDAIRLKAARDGKTLRSVCNLVGIVPEHFSKVLARRHELRPEHRTLLIEALGGEFDDYFEVVQPAIGATS
jgi:hypothetical protein